MSDQTNTDGASIGPEQFDMTDDTTAGADSASDPTDAVPVEQSGGTVKDGLLSAEPDMTAADAGDLFDTEQPWHAHAEVFMRKFLHGFEGIDGSPAVLHAVVAAVALVGEMQEAGDGDDADSDDETIANLPE